MRFAFRCDASLQIGSGHVMRCLTLARALRAAGHECHFICRDLPGHMAPQIKEAGFTISLLPAPEKGFVPGADSPPHAVWAGVDWRLDARQTQGAQKVHAEWLVLDHYAFDAKWQAATVPPGTRLLVIDDLADRPHVANLLLDQNLGRAPADYDGLLPPMAERLVGPRYALLRPEFLGQRPHSLQRRKSLGPKVQNLFIFLGGMDQHDVTSRALDAVDRAHLPDLAQITVVMGAAAPALAQVRIRAQSMPVPTRVLTGVTDMAALMATADLAIGAAGGAAWERCVLGLPTLLVVLADNQVDGANALQSMGCARVVGPATAPDLAKDMAHALSDLAANPKACADLSAHAARIADGRGLARVVGALTTPITLRPANMGDGETVWHWRETLPETAFRTGRNAPLPDHLAWFGRALTSPAHRLFMAETAAPVGHLRLDLGPEGAATVSLLLDPAHRGAGLAPRLLALIADHARQIGLKTLRAEVHQTNIPSLATFHAAGFSPEGETDGFLNFRLDLRRLTSPAPVAHTPGKAPHAE